MLNINIPGYKNINIKYAVFDFNGTIATDGIIRDDIKRKLKQLQKNFEIYVLTADTYGNVETALKDMNIKVYIISKENGTVDKLNFIKKLGQNSCIAIGNGNNDCLMMKEAEIGICIVDEEGCSIKTFMNSDIVVKNINDCLDILLNPKRLIATLRK